MRASDLRDMSEGELADHVQTARRELFGLRFQHATGELDNTAGLARAKREVARALTIQRERELDAYAEMVEGARTEAYAESAAPTQDATEAELSPSDDQTEDDG
jgi:large subunit ribosomal protein L29